MKTKGIDISYHQGAINAKAIKSSGINFVILREGFRKSVDTRFFEYVKQFNAAGLPIFGVYHFSYALNETQAKEEAEFCVKNVKKAGLPDTVWIFFDFEYDTVKKAKAAGVTLGKKECIKHTIAFCETVKKNGYNVGIYLNNDYRKNMYDSETLKKYPNLWLADYTGDPDVPCMVQQYSNSGKVNGINRYVDMNYLFSDFSAKNQNESKKIFSRSKVIELAKSWDGRKESDGSHKMIIDLYNSQKNLPRGYKMKYTDAWCAATVSALAIKLGYEEIMPIECSCAQLIKKAKEMGIWIENDAYVPIPGDEVLYDWNDSGKGDNVGTPDHVGLVIEVYETAGYFVVEEGNYKDSVKKRTMSINGKFIRGFISPKYTDNKISVETKPETKKSILTIAREVISGKWGNGETRKTKVTNAGYDYSKVQDEVNRIVNTPKPTASKIVTATCKAKRRDNKITGTYVTTANLYCRNDAGKNKKALCKIPKGTKVSNYGLYNLFDGVRWFYIQFALNGIQYTGFSSSKYLKKV